MLNGGSLGLQLERLFVEKGLCQVSKIEVHIAFELGLIVSDEVDGILEMNWVDAL